MARAGTKFFIKKNAIKTKDILKRKGIETKIVTTTKFHELFGKRRKAFLVKRVKKTRRKKNSGLATALKSASLS